MIRPSSLTLVWVYGILTGVCLADELLVLALLFGAAGMGAMKLTRDQSGDV